MRSNQDLHPASNNKHVIRPRACQAESRRPSAPTGNTRRATGTRTEPPFPRYADDWRDGCDRCCSREGPRTLLFVIEVNVFVDRATRSTSQTHDHDKPSERASDLRILGAALGNRTPDLRITRSPAHRSRRATCTDGSTHVPERSRRTGCSGLPVHDPVHGLGQPLGNRMLLG